MKDSNSMPTIEAIRQRRSIRRFKSATVPDATILQLLDCARLAPSASNSQPWRFVVLKESGIKKRLMEYAYNMRFIESAPCIVVCCVDLNVRTQRSTRKRLKELQIANVFDDVGSTNYVRPEMENADTPESVSV